MLTVAVPELSEPHIPSPRRLAPMNEGVGARVQREASTIVVGRASA